MSIFGKRKPKWEPLVCRPADIFEIIKQYVSIDAPLLTLNIEIYDKPHKIGVTSDYDSRKKISFDIEYYLDGQVFKTFDEFRESARVDGVLFANLETVSITCSDELGNPRNDPFLAAREIVTYK